MADYSYKIFGFEIKRAKTKDQDLKRLQSVVAPTDPDGAGYVSAGGGHYGHYVDLDGESDAKDNWQQIRKYRGVSMHPEVDAAIEDIVNESISASESQSSVDLVLDSVEAPDGIKKKIKEEFDGVVSMLNFSEHGHDMFRSWYIDGRLYHHLVVEEGSPKKGIQDIRLVDSSKIRKVKQVKTKKDPSTGAAIVEKIDEFYMYQDKPGASGTNIKLSIDSISYTTSGLLDEARKRVISYLHKAIKPINQLRMMEDSLVIYRLARAPERRVFYIDVGNLPRGKAEQYMKDIMSRYRNKLVYDASTGEIRDDRKHMSMLEDFWLPRREGGRGTEISTLSGGDNLGNIDDITYFQKRLYRSLNVPLGRLEQEANFSLGRSTEISRDEIKFQKFINRLRKKFSQLFLGILHKQLILKGIITEDDWNEWKDDIIVDYIRDNHFAELRDMDILRERLQTMEQASQFIGEYYSKEWIMKNVMSLSDDDVEQMKKQIADEQPAGEEQDNEKDPQDKDNTDNTNDSEDPRSDFVNQ